jgi:hypothetical protein
MKTRTIKSHSVKKCVLEPLEARCLMSASVSPAADLTELSSNTALIAVAPNLTQMLPIGTITASDAPAFPPAPVLESAYFPPATSPQSKSLIAQGTFSAAADSSYTLTFTTTVISALGPPGTMTSDLARFLVIGSLKIKTDANGHAAFLATLNDLPIENITNVSATATDASGNVSAASAEMTVGSLQPLNLKQALVIQMYQTLLNRGIDPTGLASWTYLLDTGSTAQQVATGIISSSEYRTDVVQGLYQKLLHRAADPSGLNTFTQLLQTNGGSAEQVAALIAGSAEYFQQRAGGTNDGFLNAIYHDALGRTLDPTGQAFFTQQFANGLTTTAAATIIYASHEYTGDLIKTDYQTLLNRAADSTGLGYWAAQHAAGQTDSQIAAGFLSSDEFRSHIPLLLVNHGPTPA